MNWILIIVLVVVVLIIVYLVSAYNGLVRLRNMVKDQWSQIDVYLKKRADLIPNLVETVKVMRLTKKKRWMRSLQLVIKP